MNSEPVYMVFSRGQLLEMLEHIEQTREEKGLEVCACFYGRLMGEDFPKSGGCRLVSGVSQYKPVIQKV